MSTIELCASRLGADDSCAELHGRMTCMLMLRVCAQRLRVACNAFVTCRGKLARHTAGRRIIAAFQKRTGSAAQATLVSSDCVRALSGSDLSTTDPASRSNLHVTIATSQGTAHRLADSCAKRDMRYEVLVIFANTGNVVKIAMQR